MSNWFFITNSIFFLTMTSLNTDFSTCSHMSVDYPPRFLSDGCHGPVLSFQGTSKTASHSYASSWDWGQRGPPPQWSSKPLSSHVGCGLMWCRCAGRGDWRVVATGTRGKKLRSLSLQSELQVRTRSQWRLSHTVPSALGGSHSFLFLHCWSDCTCQWCRMHMGGNAETCYHWNCLGSCSKGMLCTLAHKSHSEIKDTFDK